jgi:NADH-quinone oxidoreductase subunit I
MYGLGILKGLWVTLKHYLDTYIGDGIFTVQYPEERLPLPPRFRGNPVLIMDTATGKPRCVACGICVRACPNGSIALEVGTDENKKKFPERYDINGGTCMRCGLCVEACPFDALASGPYYELASYRRQDLVYDKHYLTLPPDKIPSYHAR